MVQILYQHIKNRMMYCFAKTPNVQVFVAKQICRYFGTSNRKLNIVREGKYINKFLRQNQSSKRDPLDFSNSTIFGPLKNKVSARAKRRVNVLNTVFMKYVTDLLSTGEIEPEILSRGIEISHVEVTSDFKHLHIFWTDNDIDIDSDTAELLKNCAYKLRHELTQLRVIGFVPTIQFVKCKGIADLQEVEKRLETLDFGEDHVPSLYPNVINCTVTSETSVNEKKKKNKDDKDENSKDEENMFNVTLPQMRHDVFDLDHYKIMSKIKHSLKKSGDNLRKQSVYVPPDSIPVSESGLENTSNILITKEEQERFSKFLIQRRKEQRYKDKWKRCKEAVNYDVPEETDDVDDCDIDNDLNIDDIDNYYEDSIAKEFEGKY